MDSSIQRKFLTLPNPARWDKDFAEMREVGINMVRTGIWTGWYELMPVTGLVNESALRALDAFVLTACKYNIQLIFTFFAFYPPLWGGENPWLDSRSIEAQQDFVTVLAQRYANVELLTWDLINEPSFGDSKRIFSTRPFPNYDRFEVAAFSAWLQNRYTLDSLQQRWQMTGAELPDWEHITLPETQDYQTDVRYNKTHNMFKVADYTFFSQEMFSRWAATMYQTIRSAGSQTLIGVGQDEAGVRLAPQFYAESVDYTTTHPWWNNDALLCDMLLDKTPFKPNLIQETGVMLVRDANGRPWRSEQENANLLERKLLTGLAARSAGIIQWLWHTNAYMTSDNENYIGLVRADGSAKPELTVMKEFGQLVEALKPKIQETENLPSVWLVVPYSQWFLRPELGVEAIRRAVRILGYGFGVVPQLIGEYQVAALAQTGHQPRTIILPAVQYLEQTAWETLQKLVQQGATLLVSGVSPQLLETFEQKSRPQPVSRYEQLQNIDGAALQLTFGGEKSGYVKKAHNECRVYPLGTGKVIWAGLPLELADNSEAARQIYQQALALPAISPNQDNAVLVTRQMLKDGWLVVAVSESSSPQKIQLDNGLCLEIAPNRGGAAIIKANQLTAIFGGLTDTKSFASL